MANINPNSPIRPRLIIPTSFAEAMSYFEDIYLLKQAYLDLEERVTALEGKVNGTESVDSDSEE